MGSGFSTADSRQQRLWTSGRTATFATTSSSESSTSAVVSSTGSFSGATSTRRHSQCSPVPDEKSSTTSFNCDLLEPGPHHCFQCTYLVTAHVSYERHSNKRKSRLILTTCRRVLMTVEFKSTNNSFQNTSGWRGLASRRP